MRQGNREADKEIYICGWRGIEKEKKVERVRERGREKDIKREREKKEEIWRERKIQRDKESKRERWRESYREREKEKDREGERKIQRYKGFAWRGLLLYCAGALLGLELISGDKKPGDRLLL